MHRVLVLVYFRDFFQVAWARRCNALMQCMYVCDDKNESIYAKIFKRCKLIMHSAKNDSYA
jgi:3-methyladenine DNA glycosylase AlkD